MKAIDIAAFKSRVHFLLVGPSTRKNDQGDDTRLSIEIQFMDDA